MEPQLVGLSVKPSALTVDPGSEGSCTIVVKNLTTLVARVTLEVLGPAAEFSSIDKPVVSLLPDHDHETVVRFTPPRAPRPAAGTIAFGVKATLTTSTATGPSAPPDSGGTVVEEGDITITPFSLLTMGVVPHTARGFKTGRFVVRMHNAGNAPAESVLTASNADELLEFAVTPPTLTVPPGARGRARLKAKVRPGSGPPSLRSMKVSATVPNAAPVSADVFLNQRKLSLRWIPKAVAALAVFVVGGVLLANHNARATDHSLAATTTTSAPATTTTTTVPGGGTTTTGPTTTSSGTTSTVAAPSGSAAAIQQTETALQSNSAVTCYKPSMPVAMTALMGTPVTGPNTTTPVLLRTLDANVDDQAVVSALVTSFEQVCVIGDPTETDAGTTLLMFWTNPIPGTTGPQGSCTQYTASDFAGSQQGSPPIYGISNTSDPDKSLSFGTNEANRDAALQLLKVHTFLCAVGGEAAGGTGGQADPFSASFSWTNAVTWWV